MVLPQGYRSVTRPPLAGSIVRHDVLSTIAREVHWIRGGGDHLWTRGDITSDWQTQ